MAQTCRVKPSKPFPSYPLTAHPNGPWCKKIRGKVHFFGVWGDPQAAVERYGDVASDLHAGRTPQLDASEFTIKDACNAFLGWQREKLASGEIGKCGVG